MSFPIAAWASCLSSNWWIHPAGAQFSQHFHIDVFELTSWCRAESLGDHAGGCEELPQGQWRTVGLGGAGHGADVQMGAARADLASLGGCNGKEATLLLHHTYQRWKSLTGSSCLSCQCSRWIGLLVCAVFPGGCFSNLLIPGSGWYPPLCSKCWITLQPRR